jgi:hypothetical protein
MPIAGIFYPLPKHLADVNRRSDMRLAETVQTEDRLRDGQRILAATRRKHRSLTGMNGV